MSAYKVAPREQPSNPRFVMESDGGFRGEVCAGFEEALPESRRQATARNQVVRLLSEDGVLLATSAPSHLHHAMPKSTRRKPNQSPER